MQDNPVTRVDERIEAAIDWLRANPGIGLDLIKLVLKTPFRLVLAMYLAFAPRSLQGRSQRQGAGSSSLPASRRRQSRLQSMTFEHGMMIGAALEVIAVMILMHNSASHHSWLEVRFAALYAALGALLFVPCALWEGVEHPGTWLLLGLSEGFMIDGLHEPAKMLYVNHIVFSEVVRHMLWPIIIGLVLFNICLRMLNPSEVEMGRQ